MSALPTRSVSSDARSGSPGSCRGGELAAPLPARLVAPPGRGGTLSCRLPFMLKAPAGGRFDRNLTLRDGTMKSLPERPWQMPRLRRSSRLPSWLWARREGPVSVAAYLAERAANRLSPASLRMDRAAIRHHTLMLATRISTDNEVVRRVLRGYTRRAACEGRTSRSLPLSQPRASLRSGACPSNTPRRGQHSPSSRSSSVAGAIQVRHRMLPPCKARHVPTPLGWAARDQTFRFNPSRLRSLSAD